METPSACDFFFLLLSLHIYIYTYIFPFPFVWPVVVGHKLDYTPSDGRSKSKTTKNSDCGNTDFFFYRIEGGRSVY